MLEAALGIAVFLEDKTSYDTAMSKYMVRVPGYIYLLSDGSLPKTAPGSGTSSSSIISYWQGQSTFQANGIAQETCRDFVHTGMIFLFLSYHPFTKCLNTKHRIWPLFNIPHRRDLPHSGHRPLQR